MLNTLQPVDDFYLEKEIKLFSLCLGCFSSPIIFKYKHVYTLIVFDAMAHTLKSLFLTREN